MTRIIRNLGIIALLPLFGLVFWVAATVASSILGLDVIGVNVHGPGLASYAAELYVRPAPLSKQIGLDARQDATGGPGGSPVQDTASPIPSGAVQPTPTAQPTPTPLPLPTPSPSAAPTPSVLPSLLPLPVPTLPLPTVPPGLLPTP